MGDLSIEGSIILKWVLINVRSCGLDMSGLGQGPVVCFYEHGSELSGSTKVENFLICRVAHSFPRMILLSGVS